LIPDAVRYLTQTASLSQQQVAAEADLDAATVSRMKTQGLVPDAAGYANFAALCRRHGYHRLPLGMQPEEALIPRPAAAVRDGNPLPEHVEDTRAEGAVFDHLAAGDLEAAIGAAYRAVGASWAVLEDLITLREREDRAPLRRPHVPGLHGASGDGHGAALTPEPRIR